jgi:hypothetical protein
MLFVELHQTDVMIADDIAAPLLDCHVISVVAMPLPAENAQKRQATCRAAESALLSPTLALQSLAVAFTDKSIRG